MPLEVTVYDEMAAPPLDAGGVKLTATSAFPLTPVTPVGAPGSNAVGATILEEAEGTLVPTAFVAVTVNVYGTP